MYFIIPIYNVEKFLHRCVDSVLNQSYKNFEIVLVDDASPDNCPLICDEYEKNNENIHVIHKENGGLSSARNAGLDFVMNRCDSTDYITFLDSDDFVHTDYTINMIELCEKNNCGIAQCDYEKGDSENFSSDNSNEFIIIQTWEKALLDYKFKSQACAKIYRADCIGNIRFPLGMLNEDEFTTYRFAANSENIAITSKKLYYYYQHDSGIMKEIANKLKNNPHRYDFLKAYDERTEFFKKRNMAEQVMKTYEKICTDIILRYCEQHQLPQSERDEDISYYTSVYRKNYKKMIHRKGMPLKRKLMYIAFNIAPASAVIASRIFTLRK